MGGDSQITVSLANMTVCSLAPIKVGSVINPGGAMRWVVRIARLNCHVA
jgi:hypothetical protein